MKPVKIGVIGCGRISERYIDNLVNMFPFAVDLIACADIVREAAKNRATQFGIPRVLNVDELITDPDVELVVNLTVPAAHYEVSVAALEAGKHVYTEKPLAVTREEGKHLLDLAKSKGLLIGGAPDTFLGAGLQTCRKLLDDGWIGRPITATGFIAMGVNVHRYHTRGVGPMFDMGPYFVTGLVHLLGPVRRATGSAQTPFPEKEDTNPLSPNFGQRWSVETPLSVCAVLDFDHQVNAVLTTTCEIFGYNPRMEIYGTEGIMICNDPNMFDGAVTIRRRDGETRQMPYTHGYSQNSRGLGIADMAYAVRTGRPFRANGELMYHALDVFHAIHDASREGRHVILESSVERPEPFKPGLTVNVFE
ncbi:MAG: Gfo/Idh/MocA family protein [Anaerolineae bacterium]